MDFLPYVTDYGPEAISGIACLLVLTGLLVPYRLLRDKQRESDQWREAWTLSEQARGEERRQTEEMLKGLELVTHIVRSIRKSVERSPHHEGDDET